MKHYPRRVSASCHGTKRIMSVPFAYYCAARFIIALRFSFLVVFFTPAPICGNCTE